MFFEVKGRYLQIFFFLKMKTLPRARVQTQLFEPIKIFLICSNWPVFENRKKCFALSLHPNVQYATVSAMSCVSRLFQQIRTRPTVAHVPILYADSKFI